MLLPDGRVVLVPDEAATIGLYDPATNTVTVGPITESRVAALVTRPGALSVNLLGMSFLERLNSYEVRGSRLILRGARG